LATTSQPRGGAGAVAQKKRAVAFQLVRRRRQRVMMVGSGRWPRQSRLRSWRVGTEIGGDDVWLSIIIATGGCVQHQGLPTVRRSACAAARSANRRFRHRGAFLQLSAMTSDEPPTYHCRRAPGAVMSSRNACEARYRAKLQAAISSQLLPLHADSRLHRRS